VVATEREVIINLREMMCVSRLPLMLDYYQHGETRCLAHTIGVVYCALYIARKLHIRVNKRELIRGGILHDYFLYDWHEKRKGKNIHGFTHPSCALKNAEKDFQLTKRERDIIKKHMFPLTIVPPSCRESWLICLADKICACRESIGGNSYPSIHRMIERQEKKIKQGW
jgi:uncharacterized protein